MFDKKKAASIILSKHGKDAEVKPEAAVDHAFDGLHAAAEDIISAIQNKSPQDMHKALRSFIELHGQEEPSDKPDGSEPVHNEKAKEKYYPNSNE